MRDENATIKPQTTNHKPQTTNHNNYALVSIIIPAYNTAPYIHKAIESSQRQTYRNIEIIIIDDGSTDDTLKIAEEYAAQDSRIRVFHQENAGVSSARNLGMREAKGEYYVFLDSDDWFEDDAVEVLLDAQMKYPDRLISANFYWVSTNYVRSIFIDESIQSCFMSIEDVAKSMCDFNRKTPSGFRSASYKIFRADICRGDITFHDGIIYGEDTAFTFEYTNKIGGAFYVSKPIINIFLRPNSATRTKDSERMRKNLQSVIKIKDIMINYPNNSPKVKKFLELSACQSVSGFAYTKLLSPSDHETARRYVKQYAHEFLKCKEITVRNKLRLIYKVYLPTPISRVLSALWEMLKKIRDTMRKSC